MSLVLLIDGKQIVSGCKTVIMAILQRHTSNRTSTPLSPKRHYLTHHTAELPHHLHPRSCLASNPVLLLPSAHPTHTHLPTSVAIHTLYMLCPPRHLPATIRIIHQSSKSSSPSRCKCMRSTTTQQP